MTTKNDPGIKLKQNTKSLADGTNARQPGRPPGVQIGHARPKVPVGNAGEYLGQRHVHLTDYRNNNQIRTGLVHVIRAKKDTWLSAATKKHGWDAEYGPEHGYGARVEGVVRRFFEHTTDWVNYCGEQADHIEPGQLFAIEIYKGTSEQKHRRKLKLKTPPKDVALRTVDPITLDLTTKLGLGLDLAAVVFDVIGLGVKVPGFLGILGPIGGWVNGFINLAAIGRGGNADMAKARAICYAATAWVWQDKKRRLLPMSSVFDRVSYNREHVESYWKEGWTATTLKFDEKFQYLYLKAYRKVVKRDGDVAQVSRAALRNAITLAAESKYKTPAEFCDELMVKAADFWSDDIPATIKPLWNLYRRTKYPK